MTKNYEDTFLLFISILNKNKIRWILGGSLLLHFSGLTTNPNDIDIIVHEDDKTNLEVLLRPYEHTLVKSNPNYATDDFYTITINKIDIDIMINFKIKTQQKTYLFPFLIDKTIQYKHESIYLSSLTEWAKAYKLMNRTDKVELLDQANIK